MSSNMRSVLDPTTHCHASRPINLYPDLLFIFVIWCV